MIKKLPSQIWFPFWVDKWIFGSMRLEFKPEERALWIDLMAYAAKDDGFIRANDVTPYLPQQLAGMLVYDLEFFEKTLEKFIAAGKISKDKHGVLYIVNWEKYGGNADYRRVLKYRKIKALETAGVSRETKIVSQNKTKQNKTKQNKTKQNIKDLVGQIVHYLNDRAGKKFSAKTENTVRLVAGRLAEGHTLDDFKRVIDVKVAKWRGDPKMDDFLRPDTLFRPGHFEEYLNERVPVVGVPVGQRTKPPTEAETGYQVERKPQMAKLVEVYGPKIEAARAAGDAKEVEALQTHMKEEMAEFSRRYWETHKR